MDELKGQNPYMRLTFLFAFFALSIGDAFNVLFVRDMALSFAPEGKQELFTGIPVTAMSVMMIAGVCVSNYIVRRKKHFSSFLRLAVYFTMAGMVFRGLAFHYLIMLAGFMTVGFGYGCFYIGIRYYAYLFDSEKDRMETMAYISGGSFAGQCMGTVLGGIMAGQMGYRTVYLSAVALMIPAFLLCRKHPEDKEIDTGGLRESLRTLRDPEVVIYLLFMVIPLFACTVFMTYTVPLEIDDFGYSSTVISAILLGSYMIAAYAGPVMTRLITNFLRPISGTFVYCLGVAALIALYETGRSFGLIVLVSLLLGLMDTFGPSVMIGAYTGIADKSGHTGGGSLLIYILVTRIGMSIAPTLILIFGTPLALSAGVVIGNVVFFYFRRLMNANSKKV